EVYFFNKINEIKPDEIEGIIAIGKFSHEQVNELTKINKHVIFVDYSPDAEKYDAIVIDFVKATKKIIDYFLSTGHKRIGFIGGQEFLKGQDQPIRDEREKTFRSYMKKKGLFDERYVYIGAFSVEGGYELMKQAIEELGDDLPTAFFTASDVMAVGSIRALHEKGVSIPEQVSIIGI